ncbi:MAG: ABC transporter ATP-binding protein [SAR324 cluster bacterium]|nr:ABC transporter ATP-binding protein [SAR324 cluster bacterium]
MALIEIHNVSKTYQLGEETINALKNISLDIDASTFVSLVGPSGSGKSTLLNLIGCLDQPTSGSIRVADQELNGLDKNQRARFRGDTVGFIFQDFNLIPVLTVYENVEYPLLMVKNEDGKKHRQRILDLLDAVGVLSQKDKLPQQISGGQKQRVAIARALITRPRLVIADEPTANLDHDTAYKIIDLMKTMKNQFQSTFIFSTHDPKIVGEAEILHTLEDGQLIHSEDRRRTHVENR